MYKLNSMQLIHFFSPEPFQKPFLWAPSLNILRHTLHMYILFGWLAESRQNTECRAVLIYHIDYIFYSPADRTSQQTVLIIKKHACTVHKTTLHKKSFFFFLIPYPDFICFLSNFCVGFRLSYSIDIDATLNCFYRIPMLMFFSKSTLANKWKGHVTCKKNILTPSHSL
jgi:hypothetical protein